MSAGTVAAVSSLAALVGLGVPLWFVARASNRGKSFPLFEPHHVRNLFGFGVALTLAIWMISAWPVSDYSKDSCEETARGYGLDPAEVDWSFRYGCRVALPSGQLIPEGRIRITSDGEIIASGEDD